MGSLRFRVAAGLGIGYKEPIRVFAFRVWGSQRLQASSRLRGWDLGELELALRVQVPNYHILSQIVAYVATILNPNT